MRILALDPGASFGWALNMPTPTVSINLASYWIPNYQAKMAGYVCCCGAWNLGPVPMPDRLGLLRDLIRSQAVTSIYMETGPGMLGRALEWHNWYAATVRLSAFDGSSDYHGVNASTWKKMVCGSGRADKDDIRYNAKQRFDVITSPHVPQDALDALSILFYAINSK